MKQFLVCGVMVLAALALAGAAFAAPISGTLAGISNPTVVQDFGPTGFLSDNANVDVTNQYDGLTFVCGTLTSPCIGVI